MTDEITKTESPAVAEQSGVAPRKSATPSPVAGGSRPPRRFATTGRGGGDRGGSSRERGGGRRGGGREERVRPEFDQKMLNVRRVARVVAGGRRFTFSVLMVIGNRKGSVGVGTGKAADTALAMEKATKHAKKEMIHLSLTKNHSIPRELGAKYSSATLKIFPAPHKGLTAGSAVRAVLELAGITDVNAKILSGSKNKLNIARATIVALSVLRTTKSHESTNKEKSVAPLS